MKRLAALAILGLLSTVGLGAGPALADVFAASGIRVDATAESAARARDIAHAEGRRDAFIQLMRRLTRPGDWGRLPAVSDSDLSRMGAGLRIIEERNSRNRYLATISYSFRPEMVRTLLRDASIPFSESQARTAVVVPVLESNGLQVLWDSSNPWLAAWADRRLTHELTPVEVPLGDLEDVQITDAKTALRADWADLEPLARRYGNGDVLVAQGALLPGSTPSNASLQVSAWRIDAEGRQRYTARVSGPLEAGPDGTPSVFTQGVDAVIQAMAREWKELTVVDYASQYELEATARFASLNDWTVLRAAIEDLATITEWHTRSISARGAELRLVFSGTVDQLALNLNQHGLALDGGGGYWQIARRGLQTAALEDAFGQRPPVFPLNRFDDTMPAYGEAPGYGSRPAEDPLNRGAQPDRAGSSYSGSGSRDYIDWSPRRDPAAEEDDPYNGRPAPDWDH